MLLLPAQQHHTLCRPRFPPLPMRDASAGNALPKPAQRVSLLRVSLLSVTEALA